MHDKEALRAQFDAAAVEAPVALGSLPGSADWNALRYRTVIAYGEYDAHRQILIDNRVHDGRAGYHVITPLVQDDGRIALVNRGWTPQGRSRAVLPSVDPPAGPVTVRGRVALPAPRVFELSTDAPNGPVWQNLDPVRFSAATGVAVMPVTIEALDAPSAPAPDDRLVRDWPAPDFGVEKHRIYMIQWYLLAALVIVLWVVLNSRRTK
jgi:surfeit locus 1 family protein